MAVHRICRQGEVETFQGSRPELVQVYNPVGPIAERNLLVGITLLLTMMGTFILMKIDGWQLHRMSLGALIIALGTLVDNAIVVVEGVIVGIKRGHGKREACYGIVNQTRWPLLASTLIAILAFTPFDLSDSDSGEIMESMFWVLTYSLFLSWITAICLTPFLVDILLPDVAELRHRVDPHRGTGSLSHVLPGEGSRNITSSHPSLVRAWNKSGSDL